MRKSQTSLPDLERPNSFDNDRSWDRFSACSVKASVFRKTVHPLLQSEAAKVCKGPGVKQQVGTERLHYPPIGYCVPVKELPSWSVNGQQVISGPCNLNLLRLLPLCICDKLNYATVFARTYQTTSLYACRRDSSGWFARGIYVSLLHVPGM